MSAEVPQPYYSENDRIHLFKRCYLCNFQCRTLTQFRVHIERIHLCEHCNLYYPDNQHHDCPRPGQRGGHIDDPSRRAGLQLNLDYFKEYSRSHRGSVITYQHVLPLGQEEFNDIEVFFGDADQHITEFIQQLFNIHGPLKIIMFLSVLMEKDSGNPEEEPERKTFQFYSKIVKLLAANGIPSIMHEAKESIIQEKIERCERGSQWRIIRIESLQLKSSELEFLARNESPGSFLPMPFKKRGLINFQNHDMDCFKYCCAASVYWDDELKAKRCFKQLGKKSRTSPLQNHLTWRRYFSRFDFEGLTPLVNIYESLDRFEAMNQNHAVNLFTHHGKSIVLMRRTTETRADHIINLFLIHAVKDEKPVYHYVLIRKLKKFLHGSIPSHVFFCQRCFNYFTQEQDLVDHRSECEGLDVQKIKFPPRGAKLKFSRPEMSLPFPFILLYDFEAFSVPVETDEARKKTGRAKSKMQFKSEFIPASYSFVIILHLKDKSVIIHREFYDGENVIDTFFKSVFTWGKKLLTDIRRVNNFVVPTPEQLDDFNKATHCKFCGVEFEKSSNLINEQDMKIPQDFDSDDSQSSLYQNILNSKQNVSTGNDSKPKRGRRKTYHHLHLEGTYECALCESCNLRVQYKQELVCAAHNASRFDAAFLVQHFDSELFRDIDIKVLAKSAEEFMQITLTCRQYEIPLMKLSFDKNKANDNSSVFGTRYLKVRFIDTFKYLSYSLSSLVDNLRAENNPMFSMLDSCYDELFPPEVAKDEAYCKRNLHLLYRKVPYPYRFLSSPKVLEPGVPIPDRCFFNNDLTNEKITDEEWDDVQLVIKTFKIPDFKSYNQLYSLMDSCLLGIVFENFRRNSIKLYGLDPTYNCSISGFSWNAFLFHTKAEVEYIRDQEMLDLITHGVRGGPCYSTQKIVKSNSPRFPNYDPSKPICHIAYFDQNSQYCHAMLSKLPSGNYRWADLSELEQVNWLDENIMNWDTGYIVECKLLYPESCHDSHSSMPLAPEKRSIQFVELGDYQQKVAENLKSSGYSNTVKNMLRQPRLLSTVFDKDHYVIKDSTLGLYLRLGLQLAKIYRGFKFDQHAYMAPYVTMNLEKRKEAKSQSEGDTVKLTSNSCFGRTLQSYKNKRDVVFCKSSIQARKLTASPRCRDFVSISPSLSMFLMMPKNLVLDKPLQTGFCILDYAKKNYYSGFYDGLKGIWGDRITNLYVDTDSTVSLIQDPCDKYWDDLVVHRDLFDFSKIPKDHEFFRKYANEYPDLPSYNKGVSGVWKIENLDCTEGAFLKSKQYCMLYLSGKFLLKTKGVPFAQRKRYQYDFLKNLILNESLEVSTYKAIRSISHHQFIIEVSKLSFHNLDISRIFPYRHNINVSYPFGHYRLRNLQQEEEED